MWWEHRVQASRDVSRKTHCFKTGCQRCMRAEYARDPPIIWKETHVALLLWARKGQVGYHDLRKGSVAMSESRGIMWPPVSHPSSGSTRSTCAWVTSLNCVCCARKTQHHTTSSHGGWHNRSLVGDCSLPKGCARHVIEAISALFCLPPHIRLCSVAEPGLGMWQRCIVRIIIATNLPVSDVWW